MIIMSHFSRRRNLIGSSQYGIALKLQDLEFKEDMCGEIDIFEGKHVIETHKFESFNLLSRIIISFWEKKLGTQVNVHRYANWLSECFEDLGLKKVTFYQILKAARSVGKGASLQSSGYEIRETQVIQMPLGKPYESETRDFPSSSAQREVKQIDKPIVATKEEKEEVRTLPIPTKKPKKPLEDALVKPSELFEQKTIPHRDSLLKPSEYLKERETVGFKGESTVKASTTIQKPISSQANITVEDVINSPTGSKGLIEKFDTGQVVTKQEDFEHKPPENSLIKPSDYIKEHKDKVVQQGRLGRPSKIPQKVESKPLPQESKPLPQESLIKPSDYIKEHKDKVVQEDRLVKPSEYLIEEKEESENSKSPIKPLRIIKPKSSRIVSDPIPLPSIPYYKKDVKADIKKKPLEEAEAEEFPEEEPITITSDEPKIAITNIKGVGSRKAMLLRENGYNTVEKIAATSLEKLSEIKGIGPSNAKMIIDSAKELVE